MGYFFRAEEPQRGSEGPEGTLATGKSMMEATGKSLSVIYKIMKTYNCVFFTIDIKHNKKKIKNKMIYKLLIKILTFKNKILNCFL